MTTHASLDPTLIYTHLADSTLEQQYHAALEQRAPGVTNVRVTELVSSR